MIILYAVSISLWQCWAKKTSIFILSTLIIMTVADSNLIVTICLLMWSSIVYGHTFRSLIKSSTTLAKHLTILFRFAFAIRHFSFFLFLSKKNKLNLLVSLHSLSLSYCTYNKSMDVFILKILWSSTYHKKLYCQ